MDWGLRTLRTLYPQCIFKILKLSIIHYLALSLATCYIPPIHTEKVDFSAHVRWLVTGFLTFNVECWTLNEEGWKINTAEYLVGVRGFCIFESTRRYFHSLQKNIQASLILFHSFIRIFVPNRHTCTWHELTNPLVFQIWYWAWYLPQTY